MTCILLFVGPILIMRPNGFVPNFGLDGLLPLFAGSGVDSNDHRSPYNVSFVEFSLRFGTTHQRIKLLEGLALYREFLFSEGFVDGFQWIDGSFVEDVERTQNRPPNDIDLLTIFYRPIKYQTDSTMWISDFPSIHARVFSSKVNKKNYNCDTHALDLDAKPIALLDSSTYWYGLFTMQRKTLKRKGMIEIPLAQSKAAIVNDLQHIRSMK